MNEYQKEKRIEAERLQELCKHIAFYLNVGEASQVWAYTVPADAEQANYPSQNIQHTKIPEAQINIRIETYGASKGRIVVSGNYHMRLAGRLQFIDVREYGPNGREGLPTITCSSTKTTDAIAADIKRRFLPEYMRLVQKGIERRNEYQKSTDETMTALRALAKDTLSPERIGRLEDRIKERPDETKSFNLEHQRGEVSVSGRDVTLKIDVTMEQAKQILKLIS